MLCLVNRSSCECLPGPLVGGRVRLLLRGFLCYGSSADSGSDLATGTLISVKFQSDNKGHGVASQIAILAAPGSAFVFVGKRCFLDLHSGQLALVDPRDEKRYDVSSTRPVSR